jgi:O-antigen ligase
MRRLQHRKAVRVGTVKLMTAMYAAKNFAAIAETELRTLAFGITPTLMSEGLKMATDSLEKRLAEMRKP